MYTQYRKQGISGDCRSCCVYKIEWNSLFNWNIFVFAVDVAIKTI